MSVFHFRKTKLHKRHVKLQFCPIGGEIELSLLLHCVKYPSNTTQIVLCNYPITSEGWWRIDIPVQQAYLLLAYMCNFIIGIILLCTAVLISCLNRRENYSISRSQSLRTFRSIYIDIYVLILGLNNGGGLI